MKLRSWTHSFGKFLAHAGIFVSSAPKPKSSTYERAKFHLTADSLKLVGKATQRTQTCQKAAMDAGSTNCPQASRSPGPDFQSQANKSSPNTSTFLSGCD